MEPEIPLTPATPAKRMRNKVWSEMTKDEQIEKLKDEVLRMQQHMHSLSNYVTKLMAHEHSNNRMVVRLAHPNEESYGGFHFRVEEKLEK